MRFEINVPIEIGPTEDGLSLRIQWTKEHESVFSPRELRLACPCSEEQVHQNIYPLSIEYVGNYAIQFSWSDGHNTGIYSFDLLRSMCSCDICSSN